MKKTKPVQTRIPATLPDLGAVRAALDKAIADVQEATNLETSKQEDLAHARIAVDAATMALDELETALSRSDPGSPAEKKAFHSYPKISLALSDALDTVAALHNAVRDARFAKNGKVAMLFLARRDLRDLADLQSPKR